MITRRDYMRGHASYREYFGDVARSACVDAGGAISKSQYLPLALTHKAAIEAALVARGDYWTDEAGICVIAVAATREPA